MISNDQGTMVVIGDVFLSVWRKPYTLSSLNDVATVVAEHDPVNAGALISLAIYRYDRVRPIDFADAAVRHRMADLSRTCRYKLAINVLDGAGLVNASIRLAMSGLLAALKTPYPIKTVDSIEAGIALTAGAKPDRGTLLTAIAALERKVWPEGTPLLTTRGPFTRQS
ncbi:MAG: hypothetical protein Q8O67_18195 [Deltaproteobacteria bacterium]|nr:hypothetical protein [Deltaproteobacteria bacterium]